MPSIRYAVCALIGLIAINKPNSLASQGWAIANPAINNRVPSTRLSRVIRATSSSISSTSVRPLAPTVRSIASSLRRSPMDASSMVIIPASVASNTRKLIRYSRFSATASSCQSSVSATPGRIAVMGSFRVVFSSR